MMAFVFRHSNPSRELIFLAILWSRVVVLRAREKESRGGDDDDLCVDFYDNAKRKELGGKVV